MAKREIAVCESKHCRAKKSPELSNFFRSQIEEKGLTESVEANKASCFKFCKRGPIVRVEDVLYARVNSENAAQIFNQHIIKGEIAKSITLEAARSKEGV